LTKRRFLEDPKAWGSHRVSLGVATLVAALIVLVSGVAPAIAKEAEANATSANGIPASSTTGAATAVAGEPGSGDKANPTAKDANASPFSAFENSKNRGPVKIQSDSLALDYKANSVTFIGRVHAKQADGDLMSKTLNVKYDKDFREIQQMVADGDVRMSQGTQWCTSDRAVQNQAAHTVVLTGSPVCHDANDQISGTKITVHTDTSKSEVEGGVKAVVFPREAKSRDNRARGAEAQ
jgi:lipopolysaccharide export system protein LptA